MSTVKKFVILIVKIPLRISPLKLNREVKNLQQTIFNNSSSARTFILETKEGLNDYQLRKNIQNPHDKFFKETFGDLMVTKDFLHHYLPPTLLQATDLNTLEPQKDTFIDENLKESFSDLLFKADIDGRSGYFYFLFEHKSHPEKNIVLQLLKYMTEIWQAKIIKELHQELPIIIPLVIYHGQDHWNTATSLGKMISGYHLLPKEIQSFVPDFEYIFYDLTDFTDEEIKGSVWLRVYLTICRDILTDDVGKFMSSIFRALDYLLEIEDEHTRLTYLKVLLTYIFSAGKYLTEKEVDKVIEKIPEGSDVVMTLAEMYRKEGEMKGEKRGYEKGKKEGIQEVAKNLIIKGLSVKDIAEATGLDEEKIEKIQRDIQ